jgi:hypothetical protein
VNELDTPRADDIGEGLRGISDIRMRSISGLIFA